MHDERWRRRVPAWGLLFSLSVFASGRGAEAAETVFCRINTLTSTEGSFSGRGYNRHGDGGYTDCAWHIQPGLNLQAIEFISDENSNFEGSDTLVIYGSSEASSSNKVASFHKHNPLPAGMALTGADEALFVLSASSNATTFSLRYECRPFGTKLGNTWFSPVGYACVLAAFIVLGFSVSLMPVYVVCYCKARRRQDMALQESQLMVRSELARRLRDNEIARAEEQQVVATLQALPTERWKDHEAEAGFGGAETDECCLCLEQFSEEDFLRVLPCHHFFHQACIDNWFSARRFVPRTCPLCKQNPIVARAATPDRRPTESGSPVPTLLPEANEPSRHDEHPGSAAEPQDSGVIDVEDAGDEVIQLPNEVRSDDARRHDATVGAVVLGAPQQAWAE
eukprot:gb/GFBE01060869.1/.p1 GENE.gb/GFBE01060869.1/~~gb/GFBE01060869.1/.p1  ORF type:complete len:395 (+),score=62.54 gb/GFBE01060869.1/:1-1185(+)